MLVHGTMVGTDALGWYSHWQRIAPGLAKNLKSNYKSLVERISGDQGNFTAEYERVFRDEINNVGSWSNTGDRDKIKVERFEWTSENHHLGRANAAVVLAQRLIKLAQSGEGRILLVGHSHAGNVFALVTQLLGQIGNPSAAATLKPFFDAGRCFNRHSGRIKFDLWEALEPLLCRSPDTAAPVLDVVTMGTPIRYGWNMNSVDNLLHVVNHHSADGVEPFRGLVPSNPQEFLDAISGRYGDYVQQTFVAQTDFPPAIWSWSAWNANRKLRKLLESKEPNKSRAVGLNRGVRVANSGTTLLVDYASVDPSATDLAGHSVYTKSEWMAFQIHEIAKRFYYSDDECH